jgi:hypothetical protein
MLAAPAMADGLQSAPQAEQLAKAFAAVFGTGAPEIRTPEQVVFTYAPGAVIWLDSDSAALIAPGTDAENPWPEATGTLGLFFLQAQGDQFQLVSQIAAATYGNGMGQPPDWLISTELSDLPVIVSLTKDKNDGMSCSTATLLHHSPDGQVETMATVPLGYDDSGSSLPAAQRRGTIAAHVINITRGGGFDVSYTGTVNLQQHYTLTGTRYEGPSAAELARVPSCNEGG